MDEGSRDYNKTAEDRPGLKVTIADVIAKIPVAPVVMFGGDHFVITILDKEGDDYPILGYEVAEESGEVLVKVKGLKVEG